MTFTAFPSETDPPLATAFPPTWPNAATAARRPLSPWADPAVVDRLKEVWPTHSATEICGAIWDEFKIHVTRNAVVGKLFRLGIGIEAKTNVHPMTRDRIEAIDGQLKPRLKRVRTSDNLSIRTARVRHESPELKALRCEEIVPLHIGLDELTSENCHWPYGNGPFTFCGHLSLKSLPYCRPHQAIAHKPARGVA